MIITITISITNAAIVTTINYLEVSVEQYQGGRIPSLQLHFPEKHSVFIHVTLSVMITDPCLSHGENTLPYSIQKSNHLFIGSERHHIKYNSKHFLNQ